MGIKLDHKRGYGHISGGMGSAIYEQDGKFFDADGDEVEFVESVTEDDIKRQEEAAAKAAAKAEAKPVVTKKKDAAPKADKKAKAATAEGATNGEPQSAVDAQIAAQGG